MGKAQEKIERMMAALERREGDRVPIGEFFWTNFVRRCKRELDVGDDFDPYRHWDLDMVVLTANMDPHVTGIEVLEDNDRRKLVKTGFGATNERLRTLPMPHFAQFEHASWEAIEALEFDDPYDPRRYSEPIDDLIDGGIDGLNPLEMKANMDVLEFKRSHGSRLAFNGNLDVQVLEKNDPGLTRELVLTRLNAGKGGGYILQSDHSMPGNVDPATYDLVIRFAREHGVYPLDLGEFAREVSPGSA